MSARALLAALVVVSVPIAVNGAQTNQAQKVNPQTKRTCSVRAEIGSRINTVRACRSAAEREAARQEQRQVVDRVQQNKVSFGR
jgi:hypothetical protein